MELFGTKFTLALGAWKLRFVLMLEDDEEPHHFTARAASHARGQRT